MHRSVRANCESTGRDTQVQPSDSSEVRLPRSSGSRVREVQTESSNFSVLSELNPGGDSLQLNREGYTGTKETLMPEPNKGRLLPSPGQNQPSKIKM